MEKEEKISLEAILEKLEKIILWKPQNNLEIDLVKVAYHERIEKDKHND